MRSTWLVSFLLLTALLTGCAGTAPKAKFVQAPKKDVRVDSNDSATVMVNAGTGVEILEVERQRLAQLIEQKIGIKQQLTPAAGDEDEYRVEVDLTRYDKGNAFARAMLMGLGKIKLEARVRLLSTESDQQLAAFDIKKTFAWGGLYGGTTRIDDVEPAFAEGIAAALTGTEDDSAQ